MLWPALAISFMLLTSVLFFYTIFLNEVSAKSCADEGTSSGATSSCKSQEGSSSSIFGIDGKTKELNNGGADASLPHTKSKHSHESNTGDSEKNTPFELPFPWLLFTRDPIWTNDFLMLELRPS